VGAGETAESAAVITVWDGLACLLLLIPFFWFGFGLADRIGGWVRAQSLAVRLALPLSMLVAYFVFALPRGIFDPVTLAGMGAISVAVCGLVLAGYDWAVLAVLGISVDLGFFKSSFPVAGLSSLPKLLFVDVGLYGYLVLRPLEGIGYDFRPRDADLGIGLREFLFYTPFALALGFALSFLHFHRTLSSPLAFAGGWLFTIAFIAIPEELFFRGLMLNLLERRLGTRTALVVSSVLFGLAHFNKRTAYFNWRYVILAAVAGVFYARAWLPRRRVLTSSITHATVDTVWSIWLR
jgi:membrane protease YdiL (CAAX protease family)